MQDKLTSDFDFPPSLPSNIQSINEPMTGVDASESGNIKKVTNYAYTLNLTLLNKGKKFTYLPNKYSTICKPLSSTLPHPLTLNKTLCKNTCSLTYRHRFKLLNPINPRTNLFFSSLNLHAYARGLAFSASPPSQQTQPTLHLPSSHNSKSNATISLLNLVAHNQTFSLLQTEPQLHLFFNTRYILLRHIITQRRLITLNRNNFYAQKTTLQNTNLSSPGLNSITAFYYALLRIYIYSATTVLYNQSYFLLYFLLICQRTTPHFLYLTLPFHLKPFASYLSTILWYLTTTFLSTLCKTFLPPDHDDHHNKNNSYLIKVKPDVTVHNSDKPTVNTYPNLIPNSTPSASSERTLPP